MYVSMYVRRYVRMYVCMYVDLASTSPRPRLDLTSTSPRPPNTKQRQTTKKTGKTKCVSNDRSGQCDQNAYRIVKIGVIFRYFRALQSLPVFRCLHGPRQHIFQGFLTVRTVLVNTFCQCFLGVRTVLVNTFFKAF